MKNKFFIKLSVLAASAILSTFTFADNTAHTLLQKYCYDCHDADVQKGKFQLDNLNKDIAGGIDAEKWRLVLDQLNLDEMPPKKKKQPSADERRQMINYLTSSLESAAEHKRKDVQVVMRRLTRQQYSNALRDLLSLDLDFGKALPPERLSEDGFKNNGEEQVISLLQTEYYQSIADEALAMAVLDKPPVSYKYLFTLGSGINKGDRDKGYRKTSGTEKRINEKDYTTQTFQNDNVAVTADYVPNDRHKISFIDMRGSKKQHFKVVKDGIQMDPSIPHEELYQAQNAFLSPSPNIQIQLREFPNSGNFILRVKVAKVNPQSPDAYIRAFIGERLDWGTDSKMFEHPVKVTGTADKFQTVEFRGRLENFPSPVFDPRHKDKDTTMIIGVINDSGKHKVKPQILVKELEFITEAPENWPPKAHSQILFPSKNSGNETLYSREILNKFMTLAFRRPVSKEELDEYHNLWKELRPLSGTFNQSIRDVLSAVLTSPKFLYIVEGQNSGSADQISEMELASRLSFFLWNTIPDYELLKLAHNNQLRLKLDSQIERMLKDTRAMGFIESFTSEWLEMEKMTTVKIDTNRFRRFNRFVREDMVRETRFFFKEVLEQNLSVMNFIDSDFTMLNQNLAEYYEIPGVNGAYFRKVSVKDKTERRGLISNGLFLSGNSDGQQGNPIKRGIWLISRILDDPPPEPPPNVPAIDPGDPEFSKLSIREQLEKHRESQSCFECHRKIDPYGLLFENYNAAGMWTDKKNKEVELANGQKLKDANELKSYLIREKQEQFAFAMTKYLLRYALGRSLSFVDQQSIDEIVSVSKGQGHKLKSLISAIVKNSIFSKK